MAGLVGPTRTGYKWQKAYNKFIAKGKTPLQARRMAGATTQHPKRKSK